MATIETNRSMTAGVAAGGMGNVVASIISAFVGWRETRLTRKELSRLSDRELDDIGLARGDIERVARGY
ncbi:DUF1127 domain-containing protein [Paracoccus sp. 1_MG-2023]|uniref:DUF1127 domain-containing protein n=1 Tax=unclassified Paracoccus (in: a-proteobacteria) TaxID=2688777 RepID=UPI001C09E2B7|nr:MULTISPECIES: DUF1127 domain-containing protein [unclassified Paracoccus (in: a-proteobacteria)]MBU2956941.1 DUF1127 domain-containing protein [Paracoccus sp. C2R09]MDO6668139.1 DUF1127 domain-containing protein [Paracoccus sp. 1_MG-2023]